MSLFTISPQPLQSTSATIMALVIWSSPAILVAKHPFDEAGPKSLAFFGGTPQKFAHF